jgi:hypothetical protein
LAARDGFAFVRTERQKLLARPGQHAEVIGRLPIGTEVRRYDDIDGYVLVVAQPKGPAGFVEADTLGKRKPIAVLAREIDLHCDAATSAEQCAASAKTELDTCVAQCGNPTPDTTNVQEDDLGGRCVLACQLAFAECDRSCTHKKRAGHGHGRTHSRSASR